MRPGSGRWYTKSMARLIDLAALSDNFSLPGIESLKMPITFATAQVPQGRSSLCPRAFFSC
jgi:hypothetical protein